jgi:CRISPR-associated protein Csd1
MLNLLRQYALTHALVVEPGFAPKTVKWGIYLDADGRLLDVIEQGDTGDRRNPGRTFPQCPDLSQPEMAHGGRGCRHFLIDSADVVALHWKGPGIPWLSTTPYFEGLVAGAAQDTAAVPEKPRDLARKHAYFVNLLGLAGESMPALAVAARALSNASILRGACQRLEALRAKPTDKVTVNIAGDFPVESSSWHDWWRGARRHLISGGGASQAAPKVKEMRCFVTGDLVAPVATNPKITGLASVGGLPTGDAMVSFDKDSFRSFGLEQGENAAISEDAAGAYRAALNHLIQASSTQLRGAKVVHWFSWKLAPADDPLSWLEAGSEESELSAGRRAADLLRSIRTGQRVDLLGNRYFALTLSGAAGRVMVRDWMEGQFESLVAAVDAWFSDLAIVRRDGAALARCPKFLAVVGALGRDLSEVPAPIVAKLWRIAVSGDPIPAAALAQCVMRARVDVVGDKPPNHARMGLLRAYHVRKGDHRMHPTLNEQHPSPAYHCGRLMAVMAAVQYRALGDVGAGLVQRYYAAASTTPALVLGRLARTSQFHLNKLDVGLSKWFEGKVAAIWAAMGDCLPTALTLEEQSLFALGYYQQIAADDERPASGTKEGTDE